MKTYDLIAIGGGSGGIATVLRAARYGAKCAVVEGGSLGGTCVNLGCVPKKVMWQAALTRRMVEDCAHYGIQAHVEKLNWQALKDTRDAYIARLTQGYRQRLQDHGVDVIAGWGRFVDRNRIQVENRYYAADHIVVTVGTHPLCRMCRARLWVLLRTVFSCSTASRARCLLSVAVISPWSWLGY